MFRSATTVLALLTLFGFSPVVAQPSASPVPPADSTVSEAPSPDDPEREGGRWSDVRSTVSHHAGDYVGAHEWDEAPYARESAVYRSGPPLRYNRVEGLVLGVQREPLRPGADDRTRAFGQLAYAFGLNDIRYTVGVESRLYSTTSTNLRFGVQYHEQTLSTDRWKTSSLENSLSSIGFEDEFFDYYEAEGLTVYAVQTLPRTVQVKAGFRAEAHRSLSRNIDWSVFESGRFRPNPAAEEGDLRALFASLTAGHISDPGGLPSGKAVRLATTVADGFGGSFAFTRHEADARGFLRLTPDTRLGLRLRGGYTTSGAPPQARFALGGVGSMRGYAQNRFRGTRMLLANAEYLIDGATIFDAVLDDVFVGGIVDAGWVGNPGDAFRVDDVLPSAGFSVGLDERQVRLDVVWPLRDRPDLSQTPSIRLRISPNF